MRPGPAYPGLLLLLALGSACAQVEAPPGGPEDRTPPSVISTEPATDVVVEGFRGSVTFRFDERISEQGIRDAVMVSPRTSPVEIGHGRDEVRVSLRRGWEEGFIYHVTLGSDIRDLFGNRMSGSTTLIFSTGPTIPETEASGTVVDRITGIPDSGVRVEAIRSTDSLVYALATDSAGHFDLASIPEGDYQMRAFDDTNRNRSLEDFESRDSAQVAIAAGNPIEIMFRLLMPDSTAPLATSARASEGGITIVFDDYLDASQTFQTGQITVTGPMGTVDVADAALEPRSPPNGGLGLGAAAGPLPSQTLQVQLVSPESMQIPGSYQVQVRGILNINDVSGDSETSLAVDPPAISPAAQ